MNKITKIKELLERETAEKGISLREIARRAKLSNQTLYGIINGKTERPHTKTVTKLAAYFGMTRDELLSTTAPVLSEPAPNIDGISKAIRSYRPGGEPLLELIKIVIGGLGEYKLEGEEHKKTLSPILDFFSAKYISGDHLLIPIKEIYASSPDIGEKIIALLLKFEVGELLERLSSEYEIEEKNPNGDVEPD